MTSRAWYLVAAGFMATAAAISTIGFTNMVSTVEGMHRVLMPGKAEIPLPVGPSTLYVESVSKLAGKILKAPAELELRCSVLDPQQRPITIAQPSSRVSYAVSGYAGQGAFDVTIETAGTYVLTCDAPHEFVIAVGRGVGTWIVIAIVALLPAAAGLVTMLVVFIKRRRQKRAAAMA